jgi:hypothetical protein
MHNLFQVAKTALFVIAMFLANVASAVTYSNASSAAGTYGSFGSPNTTSFGETFSTSAGLLTD